MDPGPRTTGSSSRAGSTARAAPRARGSAGVGKTFVNLDNGALRASAVKDIASCVEHVVRAGVADPKRVGIMGGSYGGDMVMAGLAESPDLGAARLPEGAGRRPTAGGVVSAEAPAMADEVDDESRYRFLHYSALLLIREGDVAEALEAFEELVERFGFYWPDEVARVLEKVPQERWRTDVYPAFRRIGEAWDRKGFHQVATMLWQATVNEHSPADPEAYETLGEAKVRDGCPRDARAAFQHAHEGYLRRGDGAAASSLRARHEFGPEDTEEEFIADTLQEAARHVSQLEGGFVSFPGEDPARQAEEGFRAVLDRFPANADAHGGLRDLYRASGRFADAVQAGLRQAAILREAGDGDGAAQAEREAAALRPDAPEPWVALGQERDAAGRFCDAVEAFREALRVSEGCVEAWLGLGRVYRWTGDYHGVVEVHRRLRDLDPLRAEAFQTECVDPVRTSPPRRVRFPVSEALLGELSVRDARPEWAGPWRRLGHAQGTVTVPSCAALLLTVEEDAGLGLLTGLGSEDLQDLWFDDSIGDEEFDRVAHLVGLRALEFSMSQRRLGFCPWLPVDHHVDLASLRHLERLEELRLSTDRVGDEGIEALTGRTRLRHLDLMGSAVTGRGLRALTGLSGLRFLALPQTAVTDADLAEVLGGTPRLEVLRLHGTWVTGEALLSLPDPGALRCLGASETPVRTRFLGHLTGLRKLDLGRTGVSDDDLVHLGGLTDLRALDLSYTRVGDGGLDHLAGLTRLAEIYNGGFLAKGAITEAGVARLRERMGRSPDQLSLISEAWLNACVDQRASFGPTA